MRNRSSVIAVATVVVAGFVAGQLAGRLPLPVVTVRFGSEVPYNSEQRLPVGDELVMAFIGTPNCAYCTRPEMAPLVREAATNLRRQATGERATLVSVGVVPTWVPGEGWRFLERIMNFDEVVIGRNWVNSEVVELLWSDPRAEVGTPQIVVYWQKVVAPSEGVRATVLRQAPVLRVLGLDEMRKWVEAGCPLDWTGTAPGVG